MEPEAKAASIDNPIPLIDPVPVEKSHIGNTIGSVVAILLIVLLLIVGAFYVWGKRLNEQRMGQVVPAIAR